MKKSNLLENESIRRKETFKKGSYLEEPNPFYNIFRKPNKGSSVISNNTVHNDSMITAGFNHNSSDSDTSVNTFRKR